MEDKKRLQYYFQGLIPLLLVVMVFSAMNVAIENIFLFITSFVWIFSLETPGLRDLTYQRKYKLSFINAITRTNDTICDSLKNAPFPISNYAKWILPLVFLGTVVLTSKVGNFLFLIFGLVFVELVNFAKKEIPKNLF